MYSANGGNYGPGKLQLDVFDGMMWTYDVWSDNTTNIDAWQNASIDLSIYAGLPDVRLSWTNYTKTWQSDIALDNIIVDGTGSGGGGPPTCASLPYVQDFETGTTSMTTTTGSQSSSIVDASSANSSFYGLHMQGNLSTSWSSQYSTGELAFTNSPSHVASASRVICASTGATLTLTFDIKQTYTYNSKYCWFRLTVNGTPVSDDQGNTYYSATNGNRYGTWATLTYDLSTYANTEVTVAWEGCMKYRYGYYYEGDNIYVDNISLVESSGGSPPNTPGAITGFTLPNAGGTETYTISTVSGATNYTWSLPVGWTLNSGQGSTSINITTNSTDGNVGVTADNSYGTSSMRTLAITTIESITSFPATVDFETEVNHSATAGNTGFTFVSIGWRNVEGDHGDWRARSSSTPSANTGPTGASKFLYVESSTPNSPNKTFYLWSPPYDLSGTSYPLLTFQYHMYSSSNVMGSLSIQVSTDHGSTWSNDIDFMASGPVSGNMGSEWRQGVIDLGSYSSDIIMLRFTAITGSSWASDICLDEVSVVDIASSTVIISEDVSLTNGNYNNANSTLELSGTTGVTVTTNGYEINNLNISNTGGVTIGDDMNINGNLQVTDGSLNCGSYNIALGGNLTISSGATFTSGTSAFTFDGSSTQTITTDGNSLYRLNINNSTSETAILLSGDLTINDKLTLTNGIITTGVDKVVMNANLGVSLSGGSSTCFINGNFRRNITANTNTYALPIGKGNSSLDYYPADLSNNNLTGVSYIDASVASLDESGNDIDDNISTSQDGDAIIDIKEDAIWVIRPNTGPSGGNFGVNLYIGEISGLMNNKFYVVKRPSISTNYIDWDTYDGSTIIPVDDAAGRTLISGFASKRGFTEFSDFGIGDGGSSALPIELLSFKAAISGDRVMLTWTTATEINNDYFTVERTLDGISFDEVFEMPGAGNSFGPLTYIGYDENPLPGISYYRLKQTDYDGQFEYSSLVELDNAYISDVTLYNVTHVDNTKVILTYQMKNNVRYDLYVYDITGKIVKHDIVYSESGHNQYELDIRNYQAGTYFITLRNQNEVYSDRFIVR